MRIERSIKITGTRVLLILLLGAATILISKATTCPFIGHAQAAQPELMAKNLDIMLSPLGRGGEVKGADSLPNKNNGEKAILATTGQQTGSQARTIPHIKWVFHTNTNCTNSSGETVPCRINSSPTIKGGIIYVGSFDGNLYAINSVNGEEKWKYFTGNKVSPSPSISSNGTIYFASNTGNVYAVNSNGKREWMFTTTQDVKMSSSPAISQDGTIYIGSYDKHLYAINSDGTLKCKFEVPGAVISSPAIGSDGTVYFGANKEIYAITPDCQIKWVTPTRGWASSSASISSDGTIYFPSYDGYLYAIKPNGSIKWKLYLTREGAYSSPAIGENGNIYLGAFDGKVYAVEDRGTYGRIKWEFPPGTEKYITSSPAIGSDGTIYVGSWDGNFYAINPDGTEKYRISIGACIRSSPLIADGTIYVGADDGNLYAISEPGITLAQTPWPMFRHDLRHNGRVDGP